MEKQTGVLIRSAKDGDAAQAADLVRELAAGFGETTPISEQIVQDYLASPACGILVAEDAGRVIGLLSYTIRLNLFHAAPTALIEELVVSGTQRGKGVGDALLSEFLSRMKAEGCAEVSVTTGLHNEGAIRFYKDHLMTDEALYLERHF